MRSRRLDRWFGRMIILAAALIAACGGVSAQSNGLIVSLCALAAAPEKFNDQLVTISAQYESDGTEREGLSDPSCREAGTELRMLRSTRGTKKLRLALRGGYPGTLDKTVKGTFTGVFHWNPENHPPRSLDVQGIENVRVERAHPSSAPDQPHASTSGEPFRRSKYSVSLRSRRIDL